MFVGVNRLRITRLPLLKILRDARRLLALPDNDFLWSPWEDAPEALRELDSVIEKVSSGACFDKDQIAVLFAPTGPIQEVSLSSGWSVKFLNLASLFDFAIAVA